MTFARAHDFACKGRRSIKGWLSRQDAEIMLALMAAQEAVGDGGAVVEIGVHHGKSFLLMALANVGGQAYAIDIFDQQALNLDKSGSGNRAVFEANLKRFGIDPDGIHIDGRSSDKVMPDDITTAAGPVRMFHIDGGHHRSAVLNDLALAEATLADHGIIVVDDVFRPEWPEVSAGLFEYLAGHDRLAVFAIGFNKTFLCRKEHAEIFRKSLLKNNFLRMYLTRRYKVSRDEILVYQLYPLPEWPMKARRRFYLTQYHPDLAYWLHRRGWL